MKATMLFCLMALLVSQSWCAVTTVAPATIMCCKDGGTLETCTAGQVCTYDTTGVTPMGCGDKDPPDAQVEDMCPASSSPACIQCKENKCNCPAPASMVKCCGVQGNSVTCTAGQVCKKGPMGEPMGCGTKNGTVCTTMRKGKQGQGMCYCIANNCNCPPMTMMTTPATTEAATPETATPETTAEDITMIPGSTTDNMANGTTDTTTTTTTTTTEEESTTQGAATMVVSIITLACSFMAISLQNHLSINA